MSPVSPVFHTEATVSVGLKNVFRVGTAINIKTSSEILPTQNKQFNSPSPTSLLYLGKEDRVKSEYQTEVRPLSTT